LRVARISKAWTARLLAVAVACTVAQGCASMRSAEVVRASTGEEVLRVRSTCTFDQLAKEVWGDERRGRELAALARLPYDRPVPRGTVLVLSPTSAPPAGVDSARHADQEFREGLAAAKSGGYARAAAHFREARALDPDRVEIRFNLGLALLETGEVTEATTLLEGVVKERPQHAESHYALGAVLRKRRAYERALEEFQTTLDLDPSHRKAAYAEARTLEDMGDTARAADAWRSFLRRFPNDPLAPDARRRLAALTDDAPPAGDPPSRAAR
jgi:tetratricopeptide (TPR) repeat protein